MSNPEVAGVEELEVGEVDVDVAVDDEEGAGVETGLVVGIYDVVDGVDGDECYVVTSSIATRKVSRFV